LCKPDPSKGLALRYLASVGSLLPYFHHHGMAKRKSVISPGLLKLLVRISANAERVRKANNWTQAEAAERLNGDLRWYQRIESGKYVVSLDTLQRLARAFRVDIGEFFKSR
jgi:DNA-binding XRE family transcriptional regulator